MKFADYSMLAACALQKNEEGVINCINAVIANEEEKNKANAHTLKQLVTKHSRMLGYPVDSTLPMILELTPRYTLDDLILPEKIRNIAKTMKKEREKSAVLEKYGIEPRSRILCSGPSGTGKTAFSHALANELSLPLYTVSWSNVIEQYLGATGKLLDRMLEWLNGRKCVFLFDEADMILRERDDPHEIGEIKRVVCGILPTLENLSRRSVLVATTNHPQNLDYAVHRRFDSVINFKQPTYEKLADLLNLFAKKHKLECHIDKNILYLDNKNFNESKKKKEIHDFWRTESKPDTPAKINFGEFSNILENSLREALVSSEDTSTTEQITMTFMDNLAQNRHFAGFGVVEK